MSGLLRGIVLLMATCWAVAGQAQTRSAVTSLGPDYPKTAMFIGNSFFYYNNGMPDHLCLATCRRWSFT
jgi:hypothetical protein